MKGTIKVHLRLDKTLKDGMTPIELVYSVSNQRKYLNTGLKVYPKYWDSVKQRSRYVPSQSDPANDRRLISGVFRIRFPPRYRDGMQRVVRNLLNPTDSTITAKNTITFENDNVLALAA